MNIMTKIKYT